METSHETVTIDSIIESHMRSMTDGDLGYEAYHQMIADLDRLAATKERIAPAKRPLSKDAILGLSPPSRPSWLLLAQSMWPRNYRKRFHSCRSSSADPSTTLP